MWELNQTKSTAMYTHTFNLQIHYKYWGVLKMISQYTQVLKKNVRVALPLSWKEFTNLTKLSNVSI